MASRAVPVGLAAIPDPSRDTLIAYAAKAGSTASDGDQQHSPFTTALLNNLTTPGLDLRLALGRVRDDVMKATGNVQEPFVYGSLGGATVALVPAPEQKPVAVASPSDPTADMRSDYQLAERVGTIEAWDMFLATYKSGYHVNLARVQRQKLIDQKAAADKAARDKAANTVAVRDKTANDVAADRAAREREATELAAREQAARDKAAAEAREAERKRLAAKQTTTVASAAVNQPVPERPRNPVSDAARFSCGITVAQQRPRVAGVGGPSSAPSSFRVNLDGAKEVRAVALSPNGEELATAGDDGIIRIWDAASFRLLRTLTGHQGAVYSLDYWRDGSLLASAGSDGTVRVWNPSNARPIHTFEAAPEAETKIAGPIKQFSVAFYPQAPVQYLASAGEDGYVRIWDWQKKTLRRAQLDHKSAKSDGDTVRSLSYAPSGSGEYVTTGYDGKLRIYLTERSRVDTKDAYGRKGLRVAYSPDGARLVSAGSDDGKSNQQAKTLKIWTVKGETAKSLVGHTDYVSSVTWSPDGGRIASGGGGIDKTVRLWDSHSGQQLAVFNGHIHDVEAVIFDAARSRLISVSEDATIKVWSINDQRELLTVVGFGRNEYVAYTPAGCYAGTEGVDERVSMLDGKVSRHLTHDMKAMLFVPNGFTGRP